MCHLLGRGTENQVRAGRSTPTPTPPPVWGLDPPVYCAKTSRSTVGPSLGSPPFTPTSWSPRHSPHAARGAAPSGETAPRAPGEGVVTWGGHRGRSRRSLQGAKTRRRRKACAARSPQPGRAPRVAVQGGGGAAARHGVDGHGVDGPQTPGARWQTRARTDTRGVTALTRHAQNGRGHGRQAGPWLSGHWRGGWG